MGKLLGKLLYEVSKVFEYLYLHFRDLGLKLEFPLTPINVDTIEHIKEQLKKESKEKDEFPYTFATFKEGLASKDYCTRHDAAAKIVAWYTLQQGQPMLNDIIKAAEVLLEDTDATSGDVSYLVGAWQDQALAVTPEAREAAEEREDDIYHRLRDKIQTK